MPIAHNPDTGETLFLDSDNQWKPATQAINPKTREMMAYDGKDWVHVDNAAAKSVAGQIQKGQTVSGTAPVKPSLDFAEAAKNAPESAKNLAIGTVTTAKDAALALMNPDPRAKIDFVTNLAKGIYQHIKEYHDNGLAVQFNKDPVGVIADALSLALGVRGGLRRGVRVEADTAPPSPQLTTAAEQATAKLNKASAADRAAGTDENTLAEVERLATTSRAAPEMRQILTKQQEGSLDRIASGLRQLTGAKGNARQLLDETIAKQKAAATPAYKTAFEAGDREILVSDDLLSAPSVRSAMQSAVSNWQDRAVADGYGAMSPTSWENAIGTRSVTVKAPNPESRFDFASGRNTNLFEGAPSPSATMHSRGGIVKYGKSIPAFPNIQFWDYTKGALDRMIDAEVKPDGRLTRRGQTLNIIKNKLVAQLDQQVPEYAQARKIFAGPASYVEAMDIGDNIFSANSNNFIADVQKAPVANRGAIVEQAVSKIISTLASNPSAGGLADLTGKLKSPEMRAKITALMPDPATKAAWLKLLDREVSSSRFVGAGMKGSPTARRLALQANDADIVDDAVLGLAKAAFTKGGSVPGDIMRAALTKYKDIRAAITAERDAEMVKILSGKKPSTRPSPKTDLGKFSASNAKNAPRLGGSSLIPGANVFGISGEQQQ